MSDGTTITRRLPVDLSAMELRERSMELAEKIAEARQLESRRKEAMADFKAQDQALRTRADELSEAVKSGRENRLLECRWSRNDALGRMELARLDSGEVIESRPLTAEEKQIKLFAVAAGEAGAKKRKTGTGEGDN